jgi:acyl-coenzyme A synthetase/AMP-(fatty) acid ligase
VQRILTSLRKGIVMERSADNRVLPVVLCVLQAPGLPKTRSGKIMRRVLRKIAAKAEHELGDVSTLADPSVVEQLVALRGH